MASGWYYVTDGQKHGPISAEVLKSLAATGEIQPADLIWKDGMADWIPASAATGLQFSDGGFEYLPPFQRFKINPESPIAQSRTDENRYPNLNRYLKWLTLVAGLVWIFATIIAVFFAQMSVFSLGSSEQKLYGLAISLAIGTAGWLNYVLTLASVELLCVIMDIERSTRMMAKHLEKGGR